jgi:hypothetical protein
MKIPTFEERVEFWKYSYARSSFIEAVTYLDLFSRSGADRATHRALTVAILVAYSRPFKQRPAVRLADDFVPVNHKDTHSDAIEMRDKVVAHRDLDGPVAEWGFVSQLELHYDAGGLELNTRSPYLTDALVPRLRNLAAALTEKADRELDDFVQTYLRLHPQGIYVVSLDENPVEWLLPQR